MVSRRFLTTQSNTRWDPTGPSTALMIVRVVLADLPGPPQYWTGTGWSPFLHRAKGYHVSRYKEEIPDGFDVPVKFADYYV